MSTSLKRLLNAAKRATSRRNTRTAKKIVRSNLGLATAMFRGALDVASMLQGPAGRKTARKSTPKSPARARATKPARAADPAPVARPAAPLLWPLSPTPPADAPADRGRFLAGSFGTGVGRRDYKLFVPPGRAATPRPLVVMLHGCAQDPDDFAAGTGMNVLAATQRCYVLYPAQSARAHPQKCWSWFRRGHQSRGRGEPAIIAAMTRDVMARYPIDRARVYVAGLSAGGSMAAIMGDAYPDVYAAVGVHSGLAVGGAGSVSTALKAMRDGAAPLRVHGVPTIVFHGDADSTVHVVNVGQVIAGSVGAVLATDDGLVRTRGRRDATRRVYRDAAGRVVAESWTVHGGPHAWSGGQRPGSFTDTQGPDATAEMLRFFLAHPHPRPSHI